MIQRINGQGLSALRAGDEIVEVARAVAGPDLFDDHTCAQALKTRAVLNVHARKLAPMRRSCQYPCGGCGHVAGT